ncbi:MAG: PLP-dependent aminotransferase family protein [Pseudomonadota bacterium]
MSFDYATHAAAKAEAPRWGGFPKYNFVGGHNDEASVPVDALRAAADAVLKREGSTLGTYFLQSGPLGYRPLREYIAAKQKKYAGMDLDPDEILVTSGSLQAMDLVNAALAGPGDVAILEESNYGGAYPKLDRLGVKMEFVPVDEHGMDVDALEGLLRRLKAQSVTPKFIYTIPTVHNPTGTILPLERRKRLVALAHEFGAPIYEDECYADLVWAGERPPSLYALDDRDMVVHIGSFSKNIAPALRLGYIAAPWSLLSRIVPLKTDAGTGALEQMVMAECLPGIFDDHLNRLNGTLEAKLDNLIDAVNESFGSSVEFTRPPGGIFLWVKMPDGVDTTALAMAAMAEGVAVNPGREWSKEANAGQWIRICFANPSKETTREGIAKLADICHREFGVPEVSGNVKR